MAWPVTPGSSMGAFDSSHFVAMRDERLHMVASMKVNELKMVLRKCNLRLSGLKRELRARLEVAIETSSQRVLGAATHRHVGEFTYYHNEATRLFRAVVEHSNACPVVHEKDVNRAERLHYKYTKPLAMRFDAFVKVQKVLLHPCAFPVAARTRGTVCFSLSPDQHEDIRAASTPSGLRTEPGCLRLMLWSYRCTDRTFTHVWPLGLTVRLNETEVPLKQRKLSNLAGYSEPKIKGLCEPVDIFPFAFSGSNRLEISFEDPERFAFCVQVVRNRAVSEVATDVLHTNMHPSLAESEQRVRASFRVDDLDGAEGDGDVMAASTRLSLKCPIGLTVLAVPVRGRDCTHLQCFDLNNFLDMNRRFSVARWRCGVCSRTVRPEHLVLDRYLVRVVDAVKGQGAPLRAAG